MAEQPHLDEHASIRRHLLGGAVAALALTGGIGAWAASTELSGAIIASGSVVVDTNVKKVQHPTGGIVGQLLVRDGHEVREGQVVMRLDETLLRSNLAIVHKGLNEMLARKARLEAERDRAAELTFPAGLAVLTGDIDAMQAMDSERKLFALRREARVGQKSQLKQRVGQLGEEIAGLTALQTAKSEEIDLIARELEGVRELWKRNLVQLTRLIALEREAARLRGEHAQSSANIAGTRGKISETELQIIQIDQDLSSEVAKEMREIDGKIGELIERKVAAEDQLKRVEIRAPQTGFVHQLAVHTVGGVVAAGDPIMLIVPMSDQLSVEAKVAPQDIDQLHVGQSAGLRFSAFNQRTTPEITGTIKRISADVTADQRSGQSFYTLRITVEESELARLGELKLVPGMPVEVFAKTYDRTIFSYFIKPLQDQVKRAFRER
jgi:HlyD family secretion protein